MQSPISHADLQTLLHEADIAARRLIRKLHLSKEDLDDIRQDLLVDLIARLPAFDRQRGSLGAFAGLVLRNQATRIAARIKRERAMFGTAPVSLDEVVPAHDGATRGELVGEEEELSAWLGQRVDGFAAIEQRLAVERGLGLLDRRDGALCAALAHTTIERLAAQGRGSRSTLYRRLEHIRLALTAHGLKAA
ncbi:RNA polymerase sigma-70 factor (ECF subfamily) [Tepidamorphus gemmatus]|uniref:RNA polymerase sigma-70 factor (ECF subfamily) n=1 Tax=Tepidamorphus gemmatus TaxID=747076 RepID=A0A4R3MCF5_9HYPH|nr:sigma factor [Tepidamorphus gemmatus]TCT10523.1 RNA polymerase sigma-70 factor (ECF subfamily) [Tepidamorphus gemmatus]